MKDIFPLPYICLHRNLIKALLLLVVIGSYENGYAQTAGDYRTLVSFESWQGVSTWEMYNGSTWDPVATFPTNADGVITIQNGHNVTIDEDVSLDQVVVESSATIYLTAGLTVTLLDGVGDDIAFLSTSSGVINVAGTLKIENNATINSSTTNLVIQGFATLQWNYTTQTGTVPSASWNTNSTLDFTGGNASQMIGGSSNIIFYNITINNGALIIMSGSATIRGAINVLSGDLSIGSNTLTLMGTQTITTSGGTLIGGANSNIAFGSGTVTLPTIVNGIRNLNKSGTGTATIGAANMVSGVITLTAGTIASGGNLTLDLNTGLIASAGTGTITGNMTVLKTGTASGLYHQLSSPLTATAAQIDDDLTISKFYSYDETNLSADKEQGWTPVNTSGTALTFMKGYTLYFPSATTLDITGQYSHSSTYSIVTTFNSSGTAFSDGWNLIGNPYPSQIDWDAAGWTKSNIDGAVYIWNAGNRSYESYVSGVGSVRFIPSMQGFWVKASAAGSVAATKAVRTLTPNSSLYREAAIENLLKLTCSNGQNTDYTYLRLHSSSTTEFDTDMDAYKLSSSGNTPTFSSFLNGTNYSINTLPAIDDTLLIPIKLTAPVDGIYTISASELSSMSAAVGAIYLTDKLLGKRQNLFLQPEYTTAISSSDPSERFFINFENSSITGNVPPRQGGFYVRSEEKKIALKSEYSNSSPAAVDVFDTQGRQVLHVADMLLTSDWNILHTNLESGLYLIKITIENRMYLNKIFLN